MKVQVTFIVCVLASMACYADDSLLPVPVSGNSQQAELSPEERKRILHEKTAELRRLQEEILKLNGSISHPTRIRTTIRVIEIDGAKLKKHKLSDPFQPDDADAESLMTGNFVTFNNDAAVLRAFEPLVTNGCAKVLISPTVITAVGETSIVNCYRELPYTRESEAARKQTEIQGGTSDVPGYRVMVRATLKEDGDISLGVGCRVSSEDASTAVKLNGQAKMGVNSCSMQTTYALKSGIPVIAGGTICTAIPAVAKSEGKRWAIVPAALKPKAAETGERIRKTYFQVTSERLPDESQGAVSSR